VAARVAVLAAENAQLRFALESRLVIEQAKRLRAAPGRRSMRFERSPRRPVARFGQNALLEARCSFDSISSGWPPHADRLSISRRATQVHEDPGQADRRRKRQRNKALPAQEDEAGRPQGAPSVEWPRNRVAGEHLGATLYRLRSTAGDVSYHYELGNDELGA
jgi:hypothetical protein